jgi:predicted oxidoreductase
MDADVIIVGGGLSGVVAACELVSRGIKVLLVEQEPRQSLGGQAFWSLGGLFIVNTPIQRRGSGIVWNWLGGTGLGQLASTGRRTIGPGNGQRHMSGLPRVKNIPG